ncbi:MAG TPA: glycosyltransferase family 4 protein [Steroidobacteraceae bacterium]
MERIAIFYPTDPLGHVPGGIDTIIRGILKWAPAGHEYTLFGATSDAHARPVDHEVVLGNGCRFLPLVSIDPNARRTAVPVTLRYMLALRRYVGQGKCTAYDVLDFHRIDLAWLFRRDGRPQNFVIHQDMTILRDRNCDIMWRHAPWLYELIERRLLPNARHVFTVRRSAVERYGAMYPAFASRISFLPTWFDSTIFVPPTDVQEQSAQRAALRRELALPGMSRLLVSVGRFDRQKDPLLLLRAFAEVAAAAADAHLLLIGDGVLHTQVEQLRAELGLQNRVHLLGVMPPEKIARMLRGSDLFVLSSAYEGMPIAVLEALATGLPVASTNVGEISLVVQNGVNGHMCAARSVQGLATAISATLSEAPRISGAPCTLSVEPYRPQQVLRLIYDNHHAQLGDKSLL